MGLDIFLLVTNCKRHIPNYLITSLPNHLIT